MNPGSDTFFQDGSTSAAPTATMTAGCTICNSPAGKQAAFFVAIVLFALCWHLHLYSVLE